MNPSTAVLVLDGEQRAALAVVRSLGRHGIPAHVGSVEPRSIAGGSRYAASESLLPDPLTAPLDYVDAVGQLASRLQVDLLLPVAEGSTLALLEHQQRLPAGVRMPVADLAHFRRVTDKEAVLAEAARIGIAVPGQWTSDGSPASIAHIPPTSFPLVVKPARSVAGTEGQRRKVGVRYAYSASQLQELMTELGPEAGPFLLQERIDGPGVGVFLLRWEGKILASFAHRRIREKPPSGGVSTCCESVALAPALRERSEALLAALDWNGVAMIEFKQQRRSGENYLMEINPRFWGSLQLAIDAGVDFPAMLVQSARGEKVSLVHAWPVGIRSRWCLGEVDHLITRLRRSREALDLPPDAPGRLATMAATLTPWRPRQRADVFRLSDPRPGIRETIAWFRSLR